MYITETVRTAPNGTRYRCVLLRQSYREGRTVKNRTIANLSHCTPQEVEAIRLALQHKDDLAALGTLQAVPLHEGRSVGAVWVIYEMARRLGIEAALGTDVAGKLALWQVIARVIDQGSRLSAVRLAQTHAACEVLHMTRGFDENDLYDNLAWLADNQATIERRLFMTRRGDRKPTLFLYDVTSSYLEGQCNAFAAFGYNRDGKTGKPQVVIGLLCDEEGTPVSVDVCAGNTPDMTTLAAQITKVARRFGCARVTFVGDRGMIKSRQIEDLARVGFHYITALTKPQVERLLKANVLQLTWFTAQVYEVEHEGTRYLMRRNLLRAEEMAAVRCDKQRSMEQWVAQKNAYLAAHPRAQVAVALREAQTKLTRLKIDDWLTGEAEGRTIRLRVQAEALQEAAKLDGCYVLKTDLPQAVAGTDLVHERYKDLALVEQAFRTCKTAHLEVRPVYVRTAASTRGHVLVVMLAYMLIRALRQAWAHLDLTVEEGIDQLATLCVIDVHLEGHGPVCRIPKPRANSQRLLEAVGTHLPDTLLQRTARVVTRKQLPERRKKRKNSNLSASQTLI
jgi:Transposase DDE domain